MLTENVSTLKIHKLTQEQYDRELAAGNIDESALYLTPDEEIDLTPYATKDDLSKKADTGHTHDDRYYTEAEIDNKIGSINSTISSHNHDSKYDAKGTAEAQAKVVDDKLIAHTDDTDIHVTTTNKSNWNTAYTHSQSTHARTDATKVADSTTNGNILINGTETNVYTHPNSGVIAGTYKSITVNAQGHITGGTNPTTLSGYGITDAESKGAASSALASAKEYMDSVASTKANTSHNHDSAYDAKGSASSALASAKSYADSAATTAANKVKNDLLNGAGAAYDTLSELGNLIDDNVDAIEALEAVAANKSDRGHIHSFSEVSGLQSALDGKAETSHGTHVSYSTTAPVMDGTASVGSASTVARSDHKHPSDTSRASKTEFDSHTGDTTKHITSTERSNWNAAKSHADSAHAPSNAQANQNAFSNVKVGSTTIAADTTTDTLELVGSNVTITPDATNDKVTIAVADGSTSTKGIVQLTNSTSSTSTTTAATPSSVKSAYDLANTAKTAAANAQATADGKANASHTHNYAGSSSVGGAATSANKVNSSLTVKLNGGSTEGTNLFTFNGSAAKSINITPSSIGAAASSHTHDDRYYTESEVDTKLSGKSNTNHTHNYAGSSSAGGSASSAVKLATARTISLTGDVTGSTSFDGSGNASITATVADDSHNHVISNVDGLQTALDGRVLKRKATGDAYNSLGTYYGGGSTAKYVRISFPSVPTWTMMSMELTVREDYNSAKYGKLMIYANQSSSAEWNKFFAVYHDTLSSNIKVYASDKKHIYIGGLAVYGGVSLDRMLIGDSAMSSDLTNMTITGVDSLPTTYQTATMKRSFVEGDTLTGNLSGNASTATNVAWSGVTSKPSYYDAKAIKGITRSGTTFTYTCMDGTTGTFTQQDNNTTYSAATQSAQGLMSAADKKKLDGIASGANAYSLPTASSSTLGGVKTTSTVTSTSGLTACPIISGVPYYKDTNTTYSLSSFGITATATELNYTDGVTSNIQTQLNGKAASSHTHSYLPLSGGTVTGATTFNSTVKIGNATLTYDSTNKRMVISVA